MLLHSTNIITLYYSNYIMVMYLLCYIHMIMLY